MQSGVSRLLVLSLLVLSFGLAGCVSGQHRKLAMDASTPRILAKNGLSPYVIYCTTNAPASVQEAAKELQRLLARSTGVTLPIVSAPAECMLVLGNTPATRKAGIDPLALPEEGFRIVTRGRNVFIAGRDTRDGETTPDGGYSDGTYYGVMDFLERVVGVRWIMPGESGEDVPLHPTLIVPPLSIADAPDFRNRIISRFWIGNGQTGDRWMRFMRVPPYRQPMAADYNHAWDLYRMAERLKAHPDYMAMIKGQRLPIEQAAKRPEPWKFCTTNPGLLDLYAQAVMEAMDQNPTQRMWSISPSDGGGWCECAACTALDEPCDPAVWPGSRGNPSMTPRLFTFFNEVARRVKARHPDKVLGCFAYAAYTYPPAKPMAVESNLFVMLAARPYYGYSLYHPDLNREFIRLTETWNALLPGRMGWFDYSTWVGLNRCNPGAPYPPGIPLLKLIFPQLKTLGWKVVFWDTLDVQGYGFLNTYLTVKLMWNANADVDALAREWLERAYGPGGEPMGRLLDLLEKSVADYKRSKTYDFQYRCVPEQVKAIHLPIFPQMEALYREAMSKVQTDTQRQRLEMFGANLVLLHWNLRKAGWLEHPEASMFYRTDEAFRKFVETQCAQPSISVNPTKPDVYLKPQLGIVDPKPVSTHD